MKFYFVKKHDYMDMHPTKELMFFEDDNVAKSWEKHMRENYSGGTTKVLLPALTREQARHEVAKLIWKERRNPQPDSAEVIERMLELFHKAYE